MKPFLDRQEQDEWKIAGMKQLNQQDEVAALAWDFCQTLNPDNPVQAAQLILANVERLKHVLKSYEDGTSVTCDRVGGQNVVVVGE